MLKKKKRSKNKVKMPPEYYQAPETGRADGEVKRKPTLVLITVGTVVVLVLLGLTWNFAGRKEVQTLPRPEESKTETRNEPEETVSIAEPGFDFTEPRYGIEMAYVRGGTFLMGCTPEYEDDCYDYEEPAQLATVGDFYIGKYEVTQAQWKAVMGNNPSDFKGDDLPVENVSWNDAREFIQKLNAATGKEFRLPTEIEWEYAARGGRHSRGYKYSGSNNVEDVAWYESNAENKTHPVGTKKANELGIYDMSGNVWEWMSNLYENNNDGNPRTNTAGKGEGSFRMIRGGGWGSYARGVRVSNYYNNGSGYYYNILGFRLACDLEASPDIS